MFKQLDSYLDHFEVLEQSQFGVRKNMSTTNAILNTLQYIYDNLDKGYSVVSIFLDFSKAFDCVYHQILLQKFTVYGMRGVALGWFTSYLANRQHNVTFNNKLSERRSVDCGVAQSSILGPLLFLIFINDFPNSSNFFKFILFAEHSTQSCRFENAAAASLSTILSNQFTSVFFWISKNKLEATLKNENSSISPSDKISLCHP